MHNLTFRPFQKNDINLIVSYWESLPDQDLQRMGVSRNKLLSKANFSAYLNKILITPIKKVDAFFLIWCINQKPIGYSALKNIVYGEIADIHLHILDTHYRGMGYGQIQFCKSVVKFYSMFRLKIILCEPKSSNIMPNKMLQKVGFLRWKTYFSTPAIICDSCEVNSYIIDLDTAKKFLKMSDHIDSIVMKF